MTLQDVERLQRRLDTFMRGFLRIVFPVGLVLFLIGLLRLLHVLP